MIRYSLVLLGGVLFAADSAWADSQRFSYQGVLKSGGSLASGTFDFEIAVYDQLSGGSPLSTTIAGELQDQAVLNGIFNLAVPFADTSWIDGRDLWWEVRVRTGTSSGGDPYTALAPRQAWTQTAYSAQARGVVDGSIQSEDLADGSVRLPALGLGGIGYLQSPDGVNLAVNPGPQFTPTRLDPNTILTAPVSPTRQFLRSDNSNLAWSVPLASDLQFQGPGYVYSATSGNPPSYKPLIPVADIDPAGATNGSVLKIINGAPTWGSSRRRYGLTGGFFSGAAALTACPAGFHMASIFEIQDVSNLSYSMSGAFTFPDSGSGPPSEQGPGQSAGWVRTGFPSNPIHSTNSPSNCNVWTSSSGGERGTVAVIFSDWVNNNAGRTMFAWLFDTRTCSSGSRVWCVED